MQLWHSSRTLDAQRGPLWPLWWHDHADQNLNCTHLGDRVMFSQNDHVSDKYQLLAQQMNTKLTIAPLLMVTVGPVMLMLAPFPF